MTKSKENEEGTPAEPLAGDDEGNPRRDMLKRIGLTAAALAATSLASTEVSAQIAPRANPQEKMPSEEQILAALKKQGITTLQQLAHNAATGAQALTWVFVVKGKFIYKDDARS